jgi:hypothetical protein
MRLQVVVLFFAGMIAACPSALGQKVDLAHDRIPVTNLAGPWRFHAGDDPSWSSPAFDDSHWGLMRTDKGWAEQGYKGYSGVAWYRLEITVPAGSGPLAIYVPNVDDSLQMYANGRLIAQHGGLPPSPRRVMSNPVAASIPEDVIDGGKLLLAVRVWNDRISARTLSGGVHPSPLIGSAQAIDTWRQRENHELYWENSELVVTLFVNLIAGIASMGLFVLRRREREYLWFGINLLAWSAQNVIALCQAFLPVGFNASWIAYWTLWTLGMIATYTFYFTLFRHKRDWLWWVAVFCGVTAGGLAAADYLAPPWSLTSYNVLAQEVAQVCLLIVVARAVRAGFKDAAIMLLPPSWNLTLALISAGISLRGYDRQWTAFLFHTVRWPIPSDIFDILGSLSSLLVLVVLIRRYARGRQEEERLESELEAARIVQKVLIPVEVPTIPGFAIEAVYKPASQVGGDFFQIVSTNSGGVLMVIGDVSGKGMPAAMTVSLLVGTFRTLAHYTQSPTEILHAMNQRMLARSAGGFTTCLALRLECDGSITIANAGHLAPYIDGKEIAVDSGLPLGLSSDGTYPEIKARLETGSHLTVLTDGVPEARNARGELFGFDRTASIVCGAAEEVAQAAQVFGQSDDVTVVRLTRAPALAFQAD